MSNSDDTFVVISPLDLRGNYGARGSGWCWLVGTAAGDLGLPIPPFPLAQEWPTHPRQAAASFVGRAPRATSVRAMGRLALRSVTAGLLAVSAAAADDLVFSPPVLIEATPGSELHADGFAACHACADSASAPPAKSAHLATAAL